MAHDAMMAHYPGDKTVANAIRKRLEARGITTWFGPRDNRGQQPIEEASMRALEDATVVVLVLSTNSSTSRQIHQEVDAAHDLGIPIVALIGDLVRLPSTLHGYITHPVHIQQAGKVFASDLNNVVDAAELAIEEGLASATSADDVDPYASFDDDDVALGGIGGGSGLLELTSDDIPDDDDEEAAAPPPPRQSAYQSSSDSSVAGIRSSYSDEPSDHRHHDDDDPYDDLFGDEPDVYEPKLTPDVSSSDFDAPPSAASGSGSGRYAPVQQGAPATPRQPQSVTQSSGREASAAHDNATPPPAPPQHGQRRGLFGMIKRMFGRR